ncbi:hypothetical protein C8J57DRAFT_1532505 [Mycena rebaudengoi]|nr:hypothetical protein C8J57DRAFT_1532505 [Mycena rebaudengoi]
MAELPQQRPVDARKVRISAPEDVDMPDVEPSKTPRVGRQSPPESTPVEPPSLQRRPERILKTAQENTKEVAKAEIPTRKPADLKILVDRCWELPMPTTFGQLCEASKEFRTAIFGRMKPKIQRAVMLAHDRRSVLAQVPEYPWPEEDGMLIKICMEIGGQPVVAIMDTGSQLDVIRQAVADHVLRQPTDVTRIIQMNDANGGEGTLHGCVDRVKMLCGSVKTTANLYISSNQVPFDLLLGRKWQRQNYVGIDERKDGTYLIFKDLRTLEPRYEMLVQTEHLTEEAVRNFRSFLWCQKRKDEGQSLMSPAAWNTRSLEVTEIEERIGVYERKISRDEELDDMRMPGSFGIMTPWESAHHKISAFLSLSQTLCLAILCAGILPRPSVPEGPWDAMTRPLDKTSWTLPESSAPCSSFTFLLHLLPIFAICLCSLSYMPLSTPSFATSPPLVNTLFNLPYSTQRAPATMEPPFLHDIYSLEDRNASVKRLPLQINVRAKTQPKAQFLLRQRTGTHPPPDFPLPEDEPYTTGVKAAQDWNREFAETGDIRAILFALVGAQAKDLSPYTDTEGRACNRYAVSAQLWCLDPEAGLPHSETGMAIVLWYPDPHHHHLGWHMDHVAASVNSVTRSLTKLRAPDFPCHTFPVRTTSYRRIIGLHPPTAVGCPDADSLIDPDPLERTPLHYLEPEHNYLPLFSHPPDLCVQVLNRFLIHDSMLPEGRYNRHVRKPSDFHLPVPPTWQLMGVRSTGETIYVEPMLFISQPPGASFPPTHTSFIYMANNFWTSIPLTSENHGVDAIARHSQRTPEHPYTVQVPSRGHLTARPIFEDENDKWTLITPVEAFRLRHNLPQPGAPPRTVPRLEPLALVDDTSDYSDHSSPVKPPTTLLAIATMHANVTDNEDEHDEDNEIGKEDNGEDGDEDQPPPPPHPPRSPPPQPLMTAIRPPMPIPSPPLAPMLRRLITEPLHAVGLHLTGVSLPPPSPPVPEGCIHTSVGIIRLPTLLLPINTTWKDEYPPTRPSSFVSPTPHEEQSSYLHPVVLHFRLRSLAPSMSVGDGNETPRASVAPAPFEAPPLALTPDSARRGINFTTARMPMVQRLQPLFLLDTDTSSSSSSETSSSSEDIDPYDDELEMEYPLPPPVEPPSSFTENSLLPARQLFAPIPNPQYRSALDRLADVARELISLTSSLPLRVTHAASAQHALEDEEDARFRPERPMSALQNPVVFTAFIPDAPINPFLPVDEEKSSLLFHIEGTNGESSKLNAKPDSWTLASYPPPSTLPWPAMDTTSDRVNDIAERNMADAYDKESLSSTDTDSDLSMLSDEHMSLEGVLFLTSLIEPQTERPSEIAMKMEINPFICSYRPMRTIHGRIVFGHSKGSSPDALTNIPEWPITERVIQECTGFIMEISERILTCGYFRLGDEHLAPNSHIAGLNYTREHLTFQALAGLNLDTPQPLTSISDPNLSTSPSMTDPPTLRSISDPNLSTLPSMTDSPTLTAQALPDDDAHSTQNSSEFMALTESFSFQDVLFQEHAHANLLDPVTRLTVPRFPHGRCASPETSDSEELNAKRLKLATPTPVADACTAAADLMHVLAHAPILPNLRHMRIEVEWLLERILTVLETLQMEARFLEIFFPDDSVYMPLGAREALAHERATNPDGLFQRNYYHHNAILHDVECNFLQATAILFREQENWAIAYSLEELLNVRFNEGLAIARLLRSGHLLNLNGLVTTDPDSLANRLAEVDVDYPIFRLASVLEEAQGSAMDA